MYSPLALTVAGGLLPAALGASPAIAQIEQVVVQARGTTEEVRDIPVAITAVGPEQLNRYSGHSATG